MHLDVCKGSRTRAVLELTCHFQGMNSELEEILASDVQLGSEAIERERERKIERGR